MDELKKIITEPVSKNLGGFMAITIFSGVFYGVYAYFREQACTVVCPYGRLQSVLLDRNSMIVAYDHKRGEPRSKYKKGKVAEINTGDCIDCFQCVKVCPTGIDIRHGTQMECVGCTACIDACDRMMDAVGRPKGLVRYASENGIEEGKKLRYTGRMKFYTVLLFVLTGLLTTLLLTRKEIDGTIIRATGLLYQERGTDSLSNLYNIKIENKTLDEIPVHLKLEGDMASIGKVELVSAHDITVRKEGQGAGAFFIILPRNVIKSRKMKLTVGLYEGDKKITELKTNFMGPFTRF
jgi:cytochrome c oxidase accessory protein FixG